MSSITSNQEQWSKKLSALIDYWNDLNNNFKLPKHFKDADSGLSWRFYNTYVTHFNTVANVFKRKELSKAIANAKSKRTLTVSKVSKSKTGQCTYMPTTVISSRCRLSATCDNSTRCFRHRRLTFDDIRKKGNYQLITGRQRMYNSTCYIHKSKIVEGGKGVYATRHLYPGDPVTLYSYSRIISADQKPYLDGTLEEDYVLMGRDLQQCYVGITAPKVGEGLGSFVNAPDHNSVDRKPNCVCKFDKTTKIPFLVATKHIYKNTELYMSYNKGRVAKR